MPGTVLPSKESPMARPQISTIIAKPTRSCNADCSYCSAPPDGAGKWSFEDFTRYFDTLAPALLPTADWIWHGGEPMLMGPAFYRKAKAYTTAKGFPNLRHAIQTNLLAYTSKAWKTVFEEVFEGRVSSSYDPDDAHRTVKGNADIYARRFWTAIDAVTADGFAPLVIGVYDEATVPLALPFYEKVKARGERSFALRFNYCYPVGRFVGNNEAIRPKTYADTLIALYDRWIVDLPNFQITPLDLMAKKVMGVDEGGHCPWTRRCGGRFVEIEPNGDVYNCSEFADHGDARYCFGNLRTHTVDQLLASPPAALTRRRAYDLPEDCLACEHFTECEGGCMRDALLFEHGVAGKFHYCESWKRVFTRIKSSILTGEADGMVRKFGLDPATVRAHVASSAQHHFGFTDEEMRGLTQHGAVSPLGLFDNYIGRPEDDRPGKWAAENVAQGRFPAPRVRALPGPHPRAFPLPVVVEAA